MTIRTGWVLMLVFIAIILPASAGVNITSEGFIVSETGYAGGSLTVIEVVKNAGDADSGPVTISYYLVNESGDVARVPIGSADLESITSGGDYSSVKTFLLPLDLADGAYNFVREIMGKETTQAQQKSIRIADPNPDGSMADLVGSGIIIPSRAGPGDQVRVIAAVENIGGSDAGKFYVDLYLTNRSVQAIEPLFLGTWEVGSVPATGQASTTRTFTIPREIQAGRYGILMDVDPGNLVPESDEGNNDWYRDDMIEIIAGGSQVIVPHVLMNTTTSIVLVSQDSEPSNQP
ncbi:CARDB domain-containing protein [Methanospirillum sp.]|uniref:CARDB domain-containing protein n=1 Tax=Methanospirillum sp. TaxID=45200 RepID=UPI0035A19F10